MSDEKPRILALDLSMNYVGWCLWSVYADLPLNWGHFRVKQHPGSVGASRMRSKVESFNKHMENVIENGFPPDLIVYERTDWFIDLWPYRNNERKFRAMYAQERRARDSLNQAEALLGQWAFYKGYRLKDVGANEIKNALEASQKRAVARMVAMLVPEYFTYLEEDSTDTYLLWDNVDEKKLRHDVSDAIAIAIVAGRWWNVKEVIDEIDGSW